MTDIEKIKTLTSVRECHDFYDSPSIQERLIRARTNQMAFIENGDDVSTEGWAVMWAGDKKRGDDRALQLENDRKTCLMLLYCMYNLSDTHDEAFVKEIEDDFGVERVSNILDSFVPLDRANALFVMVPSGDIHPGMHWYAKEHVEGNEGIKNHLESYKGFATINKRLMWYASTFKLSAIDDLLMPVILGT